MQPEGPILQPIAGLFEWLGKSLLGLDVMEFVELVVWFPTLSWVDFMASLGAMVGFKLTCDQLDRIVFHRLRNALADGMIVAAAWLRPR
jgi:hypothetical protein